MAITEGLLLALTAMFSWGIADYIVVDAVKKLGKIPTLLISGAGGLVALAAYALLSREVLVFTARSSLLSFVSGFLDLLGLYMFYKSMERGKLSLVSPMANSWSVVAIAVGFVLFLQIPTTMQLAGTVFVIAGLALAAIKTEKSLEGFKNRFAKGAPEALIALVSWGLAHSIVKIPADETGWFSASAVFLVTELLLVSVVFAVRRYSLAAIVSKSFSPAFLAGFLLSFGNIAYIKGVSSTYLSIVSPIASSAPIITVVLAFFLMKERLTRLQYIGIVSAITGIIVIAV